MGELNAKIGQEQDPSREVVGRYGLNSRNERGDMWVEWCVTHEQVMCNTWFQHQNRHVYTWISQRDGLRNQIYYITIIKRFCNSIQQVKDYPEADGGSNHDSMVATSRLKLRKLQKILAESKVQELQHALRIKMATS